MTYMSSAIARCRSFFICGPRVPQVAAVVLRDALETADAYTAQDVLNNHTHTARTWPGMTYAY